MKRSILVAAGIAWLTAGCGTKLEDVTGNNGLGGVGGAKVTLTEQSTSGQRGTAVFCDKQGRAELTIKINAGVWGLNQPAEMHNGLCGDAAAPLGATLESVKDEKSTSQLPKSGAQSLEGDRHILVRQSVSNSTVVV